MNELLKGSKKILAGLAIFLGFMLVCTLVSRGIYASSLPQVTLQEPKKMSIQHEVSVPGNVKQSRELAVNVPAGLRVEEVAVMPGDKVAAGDTLFLLDTEYLEEQKEDIELEIRRLDLQISEVQNNLELAAREKDREMIRAGEDAVREIQSADKNLNRAKEDEAAAKSELAGHQADPAEITSDSRREEKRQEYKEWKQKYRDALDEQASAKKRYDELDAECELLEIEIAELRNGGSRPSEEESSTPVSKPEDGDESVTQTESSETPDSTVQGSGAEQEESGEGTESESGSESSPTSEAESGSDSAPMSEMESGSESTAVPESVSGQATETAVETAAETEIQVPLQSEEEEEQTSETGGTYFSRDSREDVLRAKEAELTRKKKERVIAKQRLTAAQDRVAKLSAEAPENPDFSGEDAELEAWKAEEKALQDKVKAAERNSLDKTDDKGGALTDADRKLEDSLTPENVDSTLALYQLERSKAGKNLEKIHRLQEEEGRITAEMSGIITCVNVSPGEPATSGAALVFADINEPLQFEIFLDKDQKKYVNQGDEAEIKLGSQSGNKMKVTVDYLTESETSPGSYSAVMKLPEDTGTIGQSGTFSLTTTSDTYECCIPMEAMHEEFGNRYYVFVLEEKSGILGKELFVQKVTVNVLDKNDRYAAIAPGIINKDSRIVYSSTKALEDGKVVRMKD